MFKTHSDRAEAKAKAKFFFDVCHLFFDLFTARKRSMGQRNIFTSVYQSFCSQVGGMHTWGDMHAPRDAHACPGGDKHAQGLGSMHAGGEACVAGGHAWLGGMHGRRDGH